MKFVYNTTPALYSKSQKKPILAAQQQQWKKTRHSSLSLLATGLYKSVLKTLSFGDVTKGVINKAPPTGMQFTWPQVLL